MVTLPALAPVIAALAGPIGIVAGTLTALGAVYALTKTKADEAYTSKLKESEANLELAHSYTEVLEEKAEQIDKTTELIEKTQEQMEATEELVDTFENLIDKSKLTTDEFGEFLTLQTELEHTKSPQAIEEIESRMEELRKKSGLSKEEFNRLLESNKLLAEQFPEAGEVIDAYGNIIMDTTGKLHDLTNAELERMQLEIYNEMIEDIRSLNEEVDGYNDLLEEGLRLDDSVKESKAEIAEIQKDINANEEEIQENNEKILDLKEQQEDASLGEWWQLQRQWAEVERQNHELENKNKKNQKNLETLEETLSTEEETLKEKEKQRDMISDLIDKNNTNYDLYVDILGKQYDINIERDNENESIDKGITKRKEEIKKLEDKIEKEGDSNGELQQSIEHLETENSQLEDLKGKLGEMNTAIETQNEKYYEGENALKILGDGIIEAGELTESNIDRAAVFNEIMSKDLMKEIDVTDHDQAKKITEEAAKSVTKNVTLKATAGPTFGALGSFVPGFAKGTNYHIGGPAFLGEEGIEIVEHRGKMSLASFGLYDLPVGAKVHTHEDTVNMLRNGLVSGIGKGIGLQKSEGSFSMKGYDNREVVSVLREQNGLLLALLKKNTNLVLNDRVLAEEIEPALTEIQNRNIDVNNAFKTLK